MTRRGSSPLGFAAPACSIKPPSAETEVAAQFLLCSLYGNRAHPTDEHALTNLFVALAAAAPAAAAEAAATLLNSPSRRACSAPAGCSDALRQRASDRCPAAPWLHSAIGAEIISADASDHRGWLLTDPMDAYVNLPADTKAEIDRDVEKGFVNSITDHAKVVKVLSWRSTALNVRCESVLNAVLKAAPNAAGPARHHSRHQRHGQAARGPDDDSAASGRPLWRSCSIATCCRR